MRSYLNLIILVVLSTLTTDALARKSKREGFNFGSTVKMIEVDQPSITVGDDSSNSRSTSDMRTVRGRVGYAFSGSFDLGLCITSEHFQREDSLNGFNASEMILSSKQSSLIGGGLYGRFLFGRIMFFEVGGGFYERNTKVKSEYFDNQSHGAFRGVRNELKVRATGLGYHVATGIELPVAYNFHFISNYGYYSYSLKAVEVVGDLDKAQSNESVREVSFGFTYYHI